MNIIKKNVKNSKTFNQEKNVLFITFAHKKNIKKIEKNYLLIYN